MKKIVVAGTSVYGIENQGDEALLHQLCETLRNTFGEVEITLLARHPGPHLDKAFGVRSIKNLEHDSKEQSRGRWFNGLNPNDPPDSLQEIRRSLEACDLLVIGGDPFNEISLAFYRGLAPYAALLITLAKFLQKPTLLYAIHMGRPLESEAGRELTRFCVTNATKVSLREAFSRDVLDQMRIPTLNTTVLADPAFGLEPAPNRALGQRILDIENIQFKSPRVIGFNFRHQYWAWPKETWARYRTLLAAAADAAIEKLDTDVLFIPNCTYDLDHEYEDDRPVAAEIVDSMKHQDRAHQIRNKYNLRETLSLFPFLNLHFSNRRHSLIFAAIHGVPIVATGGEWHIKPALTDLGLDEYFISIDALNLDNLQERIHRAWDQQEPLSARITGKIPDLRSKTLGLQSVLNEITL